MAEESSWQLGICVKSFFRLSALQGTTKKHAEVQKPDRCTTATVILLNGFEKMSTIFWKCI